MQFDISASSYDLERDVTEDDPTTMDEDWEAQRILSLPERQQRLAVESKENQFDATPSYFDRIKLQGGRS